MVSAQIELNLDEFINRVNEYFGEKRRVMMKNKLVTIILIVFIVTLYCSTVGEQYQLNHMLPNNVNYWQKLQHYPTESALLFAKNALMGLSLCLLGLNISKEPNRKSRCIVRSCFCLFGFLTFVASAVIVVLLLIV